MKLTREKANFVLYKYIYVFMRNGAVHEILRRGKDIKTIHATLQAKGVIFIPEIDAVINSVDITQITDFKGYVNYINQRRPKKYIMNGKTKELAQDETVKERFFTELKLLEVKEKKLLENSTEKKLELPDRKNLLKSI